MDGPVSEQSRSNQLRFNDNQVVAAYERLSGLMPDEEVLFRRFIPSKARVLDLGVGTGRTSTALAGRSSLYVGLDYAEEMVETARRSNPGLDLRVGDATDLRDFADESFEAVVFSYNGLDYIHPDSARSQGLREIRRVLVPGGVLLLARHNPRSVLARTGGSGRVVKRLAVAGYASLRRSRRLIPTRAFWRGEGYVREPFKGGLIEHMATARRVQGELARHGFRHELTLGCHATRRTSAIWTPWYSYAFVAD